ncbi:uncharacterized protein LOC133884152 [Phragmites australis]|uniref:uncharacterized protein LOC133884152 n=1 Tax=Phragmites australis TaxID=29695 RepID=UPI002D7757CC|nr:uncharacterized protein LOC133884152 [Phragmites australis]
MSWLARSIAATLSSPRGEPNSDADESESEPTSAERGAGPEDDSSPRDPNPDAEEPEQPNTPSRGVKDDISELTETLTRRLWGVASFLAPPPTPPDSSTPRAAATAEAKEENGDGEEAPQSCYWEREAIGVYNGDLRLYLAFFKCNYGMLQTSVISVLVSYIVFLVFVDFELSEAQYIHALAVEHLVPSLSDLKAQICSTDMSESCFWKIYFVLLHSKLSKQDAELVSTPQILEAREELLQSLQAQNKQGSKVPGESSENANESSPAEEKVIQPSSIQDEAGTSEVSPFKEHTSDITPEIESEKFPIATTEVEIVDKSVIEEELAVRNESKASPVESKIHFETDEDEVDEWPDDHPAEEVGQASNGTSLGREEDVSFSDLEDDDDNKRVGQQGKQPSS